MGICYPKCIYPKCIFAKCTRLACLLSFSSLFKSVFSKSVFSKSVFIFKCIFPKFIYPKCIFTKCTRLASLLSFLIWSHEHPQVLYMVGKIWISAFCPSSPHPAELYLWGVRFLITILGKGFITRPYILSYALYHEVYYIVSWIVVYCIRNGCILW